MQSLSIFQQVKHNIYMHIVHLGVTRYKNVKVEKLIIYN